jgi:hypothetical protein
VDVSELASKVRSLEEKQAELCERTEKIEEAIMGTLDGGKAGLRQITVDLAKEVKQTNDTLIIHRSEAALFHKDIREKMETLGETDKVSKHGLKFLVGIGGFVIFVLQVYSAFKK